MSKFEKITELYKVEHQLMIGAKTMSHSDWMNLLNYRDVIYDEISKMMRESRRENEEGSSFLKRRLAMMDTVYGPAIEE